MATGDVSQFSAAPSAVGYLYQCRAALLLILNRLRSDLTSSIAIEKYDDISFEDQHGKPKELIQTKHRIGTPGSLSNSSVDLWKTVRIWIEQWKASNIDIPGTILTIVTTATASANSAASYLQKINRDETRAEEILLSTAKSSTNAENSKAYELFLNLSPLERAHLIECIQVIDKSPNITDVREQILGELVLTVHEQFMDAFYDRLEGWWFQQCISHLSGASKETISGKLVRAAILDFAEGFQQDNLPIDEILSEPPNGVNANEDQRIFVSQLRLIAAGNRTIEYAIRDYYRAFEQRAKWVREDLLLDSELEKYESRLVEEWDRYHGRVCENLSSPAKEEDKVQAGKKVYEWSQEAELFIRPKCKEPYVGRGSLHMLANDRRVGWHPEFVERLKSLLAAEASL